MGCGCKERRERALKWLKKQRDRLAKRRARESETPKQNEPGNAK